MKLNIGCGPLKKNGYINIDAFDQYADVIAPAEKLPYPDNSVDEITAYHLVEHLDPHVADKEMFPEWRRVLKPGGRIVLELPDLDNCFTEWFKKDADKYGILSGVYGVGNGPMRHQFGWSYGLLYGVLLSKGFVDIRREFPIDSWLTNKRWSFRLVAYKGGNPNKKPDISIIIPVYNALEDFKKCLPSVLGHTTENVEVIIVNNGSNPEMDAFIREYIEQDERIVYMKYPKPLGYAGATNAGIRASRGEHVILLNSDTVVLGGHWISVLKQPFLEDELVGATGPLKHTSPEIGREFLIFFCVMLSKVAIEKNGYLDESFREGAGEDTAWCIELEKKGMKHVKVGDLKWNPEAGTHTGTFPMYHKGEATVHTLPNWNEIFVRNTQILIDRYGRKEEK